MELTDSLKSIVIDTAQQLKGSARRIFMARIVKELGPGGASRAERELGRNRKTIRKGTHEVESGIICLDAFQARGANWPKTIYRTCWWISKRLSTDKAKPTRNSKRVGCTRA